jgi:hypothetical protein
MPMKSLVQKGENVKEEHFPRKDLSVIFCLRKGFKINLFYELTFSDQIQSYEILSALKLR